MFVFAKSARRPVPKQRAVFAEAKRFEKEISQYLMEELKALRGNIPFDDLVQILQLAKEDEVVSLLDEAGARATFSGLEPLITKGAMAGGKLAAAGRAIVLDAARPRIKKWIKDHCADLVKETTKTTREAVKSLVLRGVDSGRHPARMAKDIKSIVGLDERSAIAVDRRREYLHDQDLPLGRADELADKYADKLLTRRAENIARTESMVSIKQGRSELWQQLVEDGAMPETQKRAWDASSDSACCKICQDMDGQEVGIGEPWTLPDGEETMIASAHPSCRCDEKLL